jgi:tRNA (guanine37-N1)-methyltransferase
VRIRVVTIFPELFTSFLTTSLVGRAREKGLLEITVHDLREWTEDRHRSVDDEPYGGGGGMVMTAPPWLAALAAIAAVAGMTEMAAATATAESPGSETAAPSTWRVLMSPQGARLDEQKVRELAARGDLTLLCGRYEGIDERVIEAAVDEEISIGDYVLSGGELAAMVVIEAVSRQIPGVVGYADSVENDSFRSGLLDYPHYTRPPVVAGMAVPEVLLSGDHAAIDRWRALAALRATWRKRPDLLASARLSREQQKELARLEASARDEDS